MSKIISVTELEKACTEQAAAFKAWRDAIDEAAEGTTVVVPQDRLDYLAQEARVRAMAVVTYQGEWPKDVDRTEAKLQARVILRGVGALEPLSNMGKSDHPQRVEDDPRDRLPDELRGRRSYEFALGWSAAGAAVDSGLDGAEALGQHRDVENPFPPETFRSAEFKGGFNEYMRRER